MKLKKHLTARVPTPRWLIYWVVLCGALTFVLQLVTR